MTPPIVQRLREAAAALREERVSMRAMAQAHGPDAHGTWLLLMAMPCLLPVPGVGMVLGMGLLALAAAMWRGHCATGLPQRVAELQLPRHWAQRVLGLLAQSYDLAGRHARPRLSHLACTGRRSPIAAVVGLMALLIVLPIPLGNVLPALALLLIGLGLVFRDGVAVVFGLAVSALALCASTGLVLMAWFWGGEWLPGWIGA